MRVAITGTIGSGKSTVLAILKEMGYPCLSADAINHQLLETVEVQKHLMEILNLNEFSIPAMRDAMFQSDVLKKEVENYLHPLILQEINQETAEGLQFIEVPLLFECGWQNYFDQSVVCVVPDEVALERLVTSRHMDIEDAKRRLNCQMPTIEKIKLADFVIYNYDSVFILRQLVNKLVYDLNEKME